MLPPIYGRTVDRTVRRATWGFPTARHRGSKRVRISFLIRSHREGAASSLRAHAAHLRSGDRRERAVRELHPDTVIVADGTSCRHQIDDAIERRAFHVACILAESLGIVGGRTNLSG